MRGPKLFPFLNDPKINLWLKNMADRSIAEAHARGEPAWYAVPGLTGLVREDPDGRRWHVVHRKVVAELPRREGTEEPGEEKS